ncbi:MAG: oligopeptide transport system substrate-binding protein [Acidimicrobiaceae bacterium]|nr:oligopeptide transport system substrate-binding protein [Acidimicrobiaceae bacterium]
MTKGRRALRPLALVVALSTMAGCATSADKPTAAAAPMGGTLRVGITEPGSLDPGNAYEPSGRLIDDVLCEPLVTLDPDTGRVRPGLASNWIISNSGRRITMRLRKARFSNGQRVTSDDVIASLSRAASEDFAGHAADLLEPIDGWPEISGRVEPRRERDRRRLRGLTAIDASSFSIDLAHADADFLRVLAHPVAAPVPRTLAERDPDAFAARPVCAGPYRLERAWAPGQPVIRLLRNATFNGHDNAFTAGGRGYADVIEFHVSADPAAAWRAGAVDVAAVTAAEASALAPADVLTRPSGYVEYVGLPLGESSPFKDARVRRALSIALNRSAVLAGHPAARGFVPAAAGPAALDAACGDDAPAAGDPARAQALLQTTGVDLGQVAFPLYFNDELANRAIVESVARQWHDVFGMDVKPTPIAFDALARKGAEPGGVDGAFRLGWQPAAPRPDAYLAPLFTSAAIGRDNLARFVDPAFERVLDRDARQSTAQGEVDVGYRSVERRLCQDMPMIPVVLGVTRFAVRAATVAPAGRATLDRARGAPVLRELYLRTGGSR